MKVSTLQMLHERAVLEQAYGLNIVLLPARPVASDDRACEARVREEAGENSFA